MQSCSSCAVTKELVSLEWKGFPVSGIRFSLTIFIKSKIIKSGKHETDVEIKKHIKKIQFEFSLYTFWDIGVNLNS